MSRYRYTALGLSLLVLASCASVSEKGTIAQLQKVKLDLTDEKIEGGIEKAMQGYQKFLEETPESAMTPEAMRRLADLKIEKEYGILESPSQPVARTAPAASAPLDRPESAVIAGQQPHETDQTDVARESQQDFEARTTQMDVPENADTSLAVQDGLANKGAEEAIKLYKELLEKYPFYERNDQVLYQMTRAYEELGEVEQAIEVMNQIVADYPDSRVIDEIQFRRGEFYFMRKKYLDAERAYLAIAEMGASSFYYEMALYKLGWTFYKQDMLEEAMNQFVALLDHKINTGYDFANPTDEYEQKRIEDTHRVISLSFSAMGGPDAVVDYFEKYGERSYEVDIYRNLGEHYLEKRRYADAASAYKTFVELNPYNKVSPHFDMRVIEIYKKGGFPKLVIEANKEFATSYGLKSAYWSHFEVDAFPDVLALLKTNLKELANYYHALYQNKDFAKQRQENFREAQHWYHEFLDSFPRDEESPVMNYQLADLLLENKSFHAAALEYERTAYDYPAHGKASAAGYAAVYTHRENLSSAEESDKPTIKRDVIRSSLRFADVFPEHDKAALVMGAALEDIFSMKDYPFAVATGRKMLEKFPGASRELLRSAWLVVAHSSFELAQYADAEQGYLSVLRLTDEEDESRKELTENLAASIYKQGELANQEENYQQAADHFLRLGVAAPSSSLRPAADYDAATALIKLKNWQQSADVLMAFRGNYPDHKLQPEVTKKLAHVYGESGRLSEAAAEYERIERESEDPTVRQEALKVAAELYIQVGNKSKAVSVYRHYIKSFPDPLEPVVEMRHSIAGILKEKSDIEGYRRELQAIVDADQRAGADRTDRIRYLAGTSALILVEPVFDEYAAIQLTQPLERNLKKKRDAMKAANAAFGKLVDYEIGDVTAAATYYIAEIYYNFSRALLNSERPGGMDELEKEQYEMLLDEQSYPFEEKAIAIHEKNVGLIGVGVYNDWVDKSVRRLAAFVPGRYARFEESSGFVTSVLNVDYSHLVQPRVAAPEAATVMDGEPEAGAKSSEESADSGNPQEQDQQAEEAPVAEPETPVETSSADVAAGVDEGSADSSLVEGGI